MMAILYGYEVYPDREITTKLAVALLLKDDYTEKQPIGKVKVFMEELETKPIKNPSGYYLFLDLPDGEYRLRVESDYYFDMAETVALASLDPMNPVVEINLKPMPSYPFSPGTTLIRGMVQNLTGDPVPGAQVQVTGKPIDNETTGKGEWVLYFKGLKDTDLHLKKYIKGNGNDTVFLEASHDSTSGTVVVEKVEVGKTTILEAPIILA